MSSESSDSESDGDIPEVSVCKHLCEEFAEITGTDTACAQFYLQDRKWNLDVSLCFFYNEGFMLIFRVLFCIQNMREKSRKQLTQNIV